jgi:hypothetical protein
MIKNSVCEAQISRNTFLFRMIQNAFIGHKNTIFLLE